MFSLGTSYKVIENQQLIAHVEKRTALQSIFDLIDRDERVIAVMTTRFFTPFISWGAIGDIFDEGGQKLGKIEKQELSPWIEYQIFDAEDRLAATARLDLWHLSMEVLADDEIIATIATPYYHHVRNEWNIEIKDEIIDRRLILLLPIFHSDLEL